MSPIAVIILIVVIVIVVAAIALGVRAGRRRKLQNTFGPEYDRVVSDTGNRADAEKELRERERRHSELQIKPLSPESQARYSAAWEEVQIQFVDNPERAVNTADDLVGKLMSERGYPTGGYDERLANLSVEHARTLDHYREAHEISRRNQDGQASTEDLRQALVHYRALFADLLGTDPVAGQTIHNLPGTPTAHSAETVGAAGATDTPTSDADGTSRHAATPDGTSRHTAMPDGTSGHTAMPDGTVNGASPIPDAGSASRRDTTPDDSVYGASPAHGATAASPDANPTSSRPDSR